MLRDGYQSYSDLPKCQEKFSENNPKCESCIWRLSCIKKQELNKE